MTNEPEKKGRPTPATNAGIPKRAQPRISLGALLLRYRLQAGLSIKQAAAEAGLGVGTVFSMEHNNIANPAADKIIRLAAIYDTDPLELLEAAGYGVDGALPSFRPYLRSKYKNLPPAAHDELQTAFQRITAKYGFNPENPQPQPGQDE